MKHMRIIRLVIAFLAIGFLAMVKLTGEEPVADTSDPIEIAEK